MRIPFSLFLFFITSVSYSIDAVRACVNNFTSNNKNELKSKDNLLQRLEIDR